MPLRISKNKDIMSSTGGITILLSHSYNFNFQSIVIPKVLLKRIDISRLFPLP